MKLPAGISDEVAAASLLKGMTAQYLLKRTYKVERGQRILFHAAAGGRCYALAHRCDDAAGFWRDDTAVRGIDLGHAPCR